MTAEQWAGLVVSITVVLGCGLAVIRWVIRNEVREVAQDTKAIRYETTPNSGKSMNDYIKKEIHPLLKEMREDQIVIKLDLAKQIGKFEQHIKEHDN
jgi:hypothetical protein